MMNKEIYISELIRMFDSHRTKHKGEHTCVGVKCEECQLYGVCYCNDEIIETVEKWSKEHPQKHKVSKLEYDILEEANSTNVRFGFYIHIRNLLLKGYFKGATSDMLINDYLDNCEVVEDDG